MAPVVFHAVPLAGVVKMLETVPSACVALPTSPSVTA
jgi:hypothetical protein